jgi:hypothetical protein
VPLWNHAISETRKITGGPVGVGSRYPADPDASHPKRGDLRGYRARTRPLSLHPRRSRAFHGEVTYLLQPAGNGTAVTNTVNSQPSNALRLIAPLAGSRVKSAVAANLDTLKQIFETIDRPDGR